MVNWYESRVSDIFFEFLAGVKVDEILEDRLIINGLNCIDRREVNIKQQTSNKIHELFKDEEGIWILENQDGIYLFQAGITNEDIHFCPVSEEPRFLNTLYVKL